MINAASLGSMSASPLNSDAESDRKRNEELTRQMQILIEECREKDRLIRELQEKLNGSSQSATQSNHQSSSRYNITAKKRRYHDRNIKKVIMQDQDSVTYCCPITN